MLHPELRAEHDPDAIIRDGRRLDHAEGLSKPLRPPPPSRSRVALGSTATGRSTRQRPRRVSSPLPRSALSSPVTQYTSHFRGPRQGGEMHVVLVDNGRSERLGMEEFWTSLKCIRCGACMNTCPV